MNKQQDLEFFVGRPFSFWIRAVMRGEFNQIEQLSSKCETFSVGKTIGALVCAA